MATYDHGVTTLSDGVHAYLQPDGAWGLNNAGLITSQGHSLLIDTLYDLGRTRRMLSDFARVDDAAKRIDTLVNTHANGDHCWGNRAVGNAEIIASRRSAAEMERLPPKRLAMLVKLARLTQRFGAPARSLLSTLGKLGLPELAAVGRAAPFVLHAFGRYDFADLALALPTRTFDDALTLQLGERTIELFDVGPAHTEGDVIVHVPDARTVFTGDILFADAHPIVWAGPFSNWIRACERIEALAPERIVPGHGRLATLADVRKTAEYLRYVHSEAARRHAAGMSARDAARDIALDGFRHWSESERLIVNVTMVYRELEGGEAPSAIALFASMAEFWQPQA
jgi:cyclase